MSAAVTACSLDDRPSLGRHEFGVPVGSGASGSAGVGGLDAGGQAPAITAPATSAFPPPLADEDAGEPPVTTAPEGGVSDCAAGTYSGTFTCTLDPSTVLPPAIAPAPPPTASASMTFTLVPSRDGKALEFSGAAVTFPYGAFVAGANVSGRLDCVARTFYAQIADGLYLPVGLPFTGAVDGRLDPGAARLEGSWWHAPPTSGSCIGTWVATLQP